MATADISHLNEERKSEKTVYKRRSSIFHTRVITCDQIEGNEDTTNVNRLNKVNKEYITENNDETFNLNEYIKKLRQERKDWQTEYKNRKTQRKNLTKQKRNVEERGQAFDINILTESDRVFLSTRPNYKLICQNSPKLLDAAIKISILSKNIHKLNKTLIEKMENNISTATKNVIKLSEQ